jgi:hypothetical protein
MCCEICSNEEKETQSIDNQDICESCVENLNKCCNCDRPIMDLYKSADNYNNYCSECYSDLPICNHCEEIVSETNSDDHCVDCADLFCECVYCSSTVLETDTVLDSDNDYVCEDCQDDGCEPVDDNYWHPYENLFRHSDGEWYTYKEVGAINDYHDSDISRIPGSSSGNYVGFELEIVPKHDRNELAEEVYEIGELHCEEDSSLDDEGFEIISNYGDLSKVLHLASELSNLLKGNAYSHDTSCCGLHVHLTKSDEFNNAKMIVFWNDPDNRSFIKLFARRESRNYAAFDGNKNKKTLPKNSNECQSFNYQDDKYKAVRVTSKGTIEVRAFKGTIRKETLLACIELAYYSYEYCKIVNSGEDLTYQKFLNWLPEGSKHIKPYLEEKDFFKKELVFDIISKLNIPLSI